MKTILLVVAVIIAISIFGLLNYYIGLRGWQGLFRFIPRLDKRVYWILFWILALSYLMGRFSPRFLPGIGEGLTIVGAYWMAAMLYFFIILVLVDIIRLLDKGIGFLPLVIKQNPIYAGITVFLLVVGVLIFGAWNARHPRVNHYDLTIAKTAGSIKQLHLVMVSDIHLGTIVGNDRLIKMVDMVNRQNPDIILFSGDIIDESVGPFVEQKMAVTLKKLHPKYGTYAVLGNHEYIGGHAEEAIKYLHEAGVRVLRDKEVKIADSFYVIGRDDRSGARFTGHTRQELSALLTGVDRRLPLILLDHQPANLDEPKQQGIDLQLSGHTHAGQLFPDRLVTSRIYEVDWGYKRKDNFQVIVTSGYGTWGPPVRTGNTPEIVDINLHFAQ